MKFWLLQSAIALDQFFNAFLCGGWADETMSSYAYRMDLQGKPFGVMRRVIDTIFFWQPSHCEQAFLSEKYRRQSPPEER